MTDLAILRQLPNELGLTPFEVLTGFVLGREPAEPLPNGGGTPRSELEKVLLDALQQPPCHVAFSGGRDSSAILALATHVARRAGLPDPIPLSQRYPDAPESEESDWQELVIGHLGLTDWGRIVISGDVDIIGEEAITAVRRYGPLYPNFGHISLPMFRAASGGCLLTGEGGDEFFDDRRGVLARRQFARLIRRPGRGKAVALARSTAPISLRRRWEADRLRQSGMWYAWLSAEMRERAIAALAADIASEPLTWSRGIRWKARHRMPAAGARSARMVAADVGTNVIDPMYDSRFVASLAKTRPLLGYRDRTTAYLEFFHDLLPEPVLRRESKAGFGQAVITDRARAFARHWDGSGLEPDLVNVDVLRELMLSETPPGPAAGLLQLAYIACGRS